MAIAASQSNFADRGQTKWKWTALGSTVVGSSIGDWVSVADYDYKTVNQGGTFGTSLAAVTWQGSNNGNTSDAVPFTLHTPAMVTIVATTFTGAPVAEAAEYIRPIISVASTLSAIDCYAFARKSEA
jgi:hypothetical protein